MEGDVISQEAKSNTLNGFDYQERSTGQTKGICASEQIVCLEVSRAHSCIPRCDKQAWQDFKVKQCTDVQPVSRRGGCMLLAGQSQSEN